VTIAANVTGSGNSFNFSDTAFNVVVDTVNGVNGITTNAGDATLSTTALSGGLILNQPINVGSSNTLTLTTNNGIILQNPPTSPTSFGGLITAGTLTGSAGGVTLDLVANNISNFGPFTTPSCLGGSCIGLFVATNLTVDGAITTGGGDIDLFASSTNTLTQAPLSVITAPARSMLASSAM
jgi:hypothetical protein